MCACRDSAEESARSQSAAGAASDDEAAAGEEDGAAGEISAQPEFEGHAARDVSLPLQSAAPVL